MAVKGQRLIQIVAVLAFIGLFGGGTILGLSEFEAAAYDEFDVTNESHSPSSLPANVTVNKVYQGVEEGSETIEFYDASAGTETVLTKGESENYTVVSYKNGKFEVDNVPDYNASDGDELRFDYTYKKDGDASSFLTSTINAYDVIPDMLKVVVVFGFIAVLISLLWFAIARTGMMGGSRAGL